MPSHGLNPAQPNRQLLLPVLNGLIWLVNLVASTLLYRRGEDLQIAAYLLWGTSALTGVLLSIGSLLLIFFSDPLKIIR